MGSRAGRPADLALIVVLLLALVEVGACFYGSVAVCKVASLLGQEAFYIAVGVLIYILASGGFGLRLVSSLLATASATVLVKVVLNLPRPPSSLWLVHASGPGFPSGHTSMTVTFWLLVTLYTRSPILAGIGVLHSLAVAYSRLALHVHYLRDVIGGALLALALNTPLYAWWKRVDTISYTTYTSAASLAASLLAAYTMPGYLSAWKLVGLSLGLLSAALILYYERLKIVVAIDNGLRSLKLRILALLYSLAWIIAAIPLSHQSIPGTILGYALLSANVAASRPIIAFLAEKT